MDNVRIFLILALVFLGMSLWQAWEQDYGVKTISASGQVATEAVDQAIPQAPAVAPIDAEMPATSQQALSPVADASAKNISVETDVLRLTINTAGGTIDSAYLLNYPITLENPEEKFHLLNTSADNYFVAQSGLLTSETSRAPNHRAVYTVEQDGYSMQDGDDKLTVDLHWRSEEGLKVTKRFVFSKGSYAFEVQHIVTNESDSEWTGRDYRQFQRGEPADDGKSVFMYTYTGGAIYSEEDKYQKYSFDELADGDLKKDVRNGWLAMIQHYFMAAYIPVSDQTNHFYGKQLPNGRYVIGGYTPAAKIAPGDTHSFSGTLVVGPKLQESLAEIAPGLDLTVDYGWLTIIAQPMWWVLEWIFGLVHNWGWSIIIFTILIKLVFFKLSETSYKSMANMRKMAPRIQALKERYGDDKQRMQQAMMEIYKKEKINPLGGCLPMLVQMPFFIALYWVLMESVELRQAPWILWFNDLSLKDPYFVLPVLMGATMLIQQKLNPPPPDPMQAKVMMALPIVFTAMFAFFPSGLVLYWFINNLLSIAQQWVITRRIEQAAAKI